MWKLLKRLFLCCFIILLIFVGYITIKGYKLYNDAINETPLSEMIGKIKSKDNYTTIDKMPQLYKRAVICVEDHRFYTHGGVDIFSIWRAVVNDVKAMGFIEGGSTITQQLAKNIYFTQEKKLTRKVAEIFMAFEIENECSKNEILELYLNTSYFGEGCYTVSEACRFYFDKEPIQMNDYESTMLAGIPNAPSVYAPTQNLELASQRQRQVLSKMVEYGELSVEESNRILGVPSGDVPSGDGEVRQNA